MVAWLSLSLDAQPAEVAWSVRARGAEDPVGVQPVAVIREHGDTLEIAADQDGIVRLTFRRPASASGFAASTCPTFQVDRSMPLLHPSPGSDCRLDGRTVVVTLARQAARHVDSKFLYTLVNGNRLAVRYRAHDRRYTEMAFSLRHAKRAVKQALGGRRIRPR